MKTKRTVCVFLFVAITLLFVLRRTGTPLRFNALRMMQHEGVDKSMCPGSNRTPRPYLIPRDDQLDGLNETQLFDIYWTYINTVQALCMNQTRVGLIKDGGKEVCIDETFKPRQPCIVYSFGSNNQFDFESSAAEEFNCEIHTFNPRGLENWKIPENVKFHDVGIRGVDEADFYGTKGTEMKTLLEIMKDLRHEQATIDILTMDVDGWEWKALPEMLESGLLKNVKQMYIAFHFQGNNTTMVHQLKTLRQLYEHGFYIFMRARNPAIIHDDKTPVNELAMINIHWTQ